ncbi:MAG: RND transporter [Desulfuromonas sp.]|nr:MAG: RND transporter [Desulfuromonas sp.]
MTFLRKIPYPPLFLAALLLGLAPFKPEPHLVEKLRMLLNGILTRPIDIFDLLFHASPLLILALKFLAHKKQ